MLRRFAVPAALAAVFFCLPAQAQNSSARSGAAAQDVPDDLQPGDAFGEPTTLPEKTIVYVKGSASWDDAFPALVSAFKSLNQYLDKEGMKAAGPAMTIYTSTDDRGFSFNAALPVAEPPKISPAGDIAVGKSPSGKALKFVHRGSYDAMDSTYEAIANYLDDKQLEAKNLFIEEYVSDLQKTGPDHLVVNVYVPIN
jgi:effector-binding domain-containing protein